MMGRRIAANSSLQLLVHHRDFSLVWIAGLISMMGDWVLWIVLPLGHGGTVRWEPMWDVVVAKWGKVV